MVSRFPRPGSKVAHPLVSAAVLGMVPLPPVCRLEPSPTPFALSELGPSNNQCCEVLISECDQVRRLNDVTEVSGGSYLLTVSEETTRRDEGLLRALKPSGNQLGKLDTRVVEEFILIIGDLVFEQTSIAIRPQKSAYRPR